MNVYNATATNTNNNSKGPYFFVFRNYVEG